jgi:hypothetical protein
VRGPTCRRNRGLTPLAAGLAVVALLAGGCARATVHPTATAPAGRTIASPVVAPAYAWTRRASSALDLGGGSTSTLSAVLSPQVNDAPWLIAGTIRHADGTTSAAVWSSRNTLRWRVAILAGTDGRALAAADWGARAVIVGSIGSGLQRRAAVWLSSGPGQPFVPVPADAGLLATPEPGPRGSTVTGSASMDVVGAGTQGIFAGGSVSGRQAVWYSTDGVHWVRVPGAESLMGGAAQVDTILATPDGVLAVGTVPDGTQTDGAIWQSSDGISWHRFAAGDNPFAGGGDHRIDGLTTNATGSLIAVGGVRSGPSWTPASWISPNGADWSQPSEALPTSTRPQAGQGGTIVRAVATTTTSALVAVGGSSTAQRMWTSTDGLDWTEVPLPAAAAASTEWTADLVAASGTTTIVVDSTAGQPRVLVDRDGVWDEVSADTRVFGPEAPVAAPGGLAEDAGRLVLAVDVDRPGPVIGEAAPSVVIVSSADGTHWRRLTATDALTGARFDAVRLLDGSLVAVGSSVTSQHGPAATIWTSSDGRRWRVVATYPGGAAAVRAATTVGVLGSELVAAGAAPIGAGSDATPAALSWSKTSTRSWSGDAPLDGTPSLAAEQPLGSCSDGRTLVVVGDGTREGVPRTANSTAASTPTSTSTSVVVAGSAAGPDGQGSDGTLADVWATVDGRTWTAGTVSPLSGSGGHETMQGCVALASGFLAWGGTPGGQGVDVPALWTSPDGVDWTKEDLPTLAVSGAAAPVTDLITSGSSQFAVSGGLLAASADPTEPSVASDDPVLPAAAPAMTSGPDGGAFVWESEDSGQTWSRLVTTGRAWDASASLATDLVASLGGDLVVVGQDDGRIAVWTGDPEP